MRNECQHSNPKSPAEEATHLREIEEIGDYIPKEFSDHSDGSIRCQVHAEVKRVVGAYENLRAKLDAATSEKGNAFVEGAKWWEWMKTGAMMLQGDQTTAVCEAAQRKYDFRPMLEQELEAKLAAAGERERGLRDDLKKEEAACLQVIAERDNLQDEFDAIATKLGVETEYSNARGIQDVREDCENAIDALAQPAERTEGEK